MKRALKVATLSLAILSAHAWSAETTTTAPAGSPAKELSAKQDQRLFNISRQGYEAMYDVQRARLALFSGYPDEAKKFVDHALTLLSADEGDWKAFLKADKLSPHDVYDYVVIDAGIDVAEDYVATPEKQQAIGKANEKLGKGDHKGAVEELRLAGVGVTETQILMPLKHTLQSVQKAQSLLKSGKYYEANLALKGAEDGIVSDTETISSTPDKAGK